MSKSNAFETDLLELIFNAVAITGIAQDNAAPVALEVALHTADPADAGDQSTSEVAYTGYARVTVARTSGGWNVAGNSVSNTAAINFPECTGGSAMATHFSVGPVGSNVALYHGALSSSLAISSGITPSFGVGELTITED